MQEYIGANKKIKIFNDDAFEWKSNKKYDLIFIDGPKSKQEILVDKYLTYLNPNGTMVVDNILLKKFDGREVLTKNQKKLIQKVRDFSKWLELNKNVEILDIDDGIAIIHS